MKEAWVVDYVDQHGDRHIKTFAKKRDADAHHAIVGVAVRAGTHIADSKSATVAKAAELWLASCDAAGLERATITAYRQHVDLHIVPILGALRLTQLTVPLIRGFEDRLRQDGRSPAMVRKARRPATATSRPSPRSATPTPITPSSPLRSAPAPTPPTARASPLRRPPSCGWQAATRPVSNARPSPPIASTAISYSLNIARKFPKKCECGSATRM